MFQIADRLATVCLPNWRRSRPGENPKPPGSVHRENRTRSTPKAATLVEERGTTLEAQHPSLFPIGNEYREGKVKQNPTGVKSTW